MSKNKKRKIYKVMGPLIDHTLILNHFVNLMKKYNYKLNSKEEKETAVHNLQFYIVAYFFRCLDM